MAAFWWARIRPKRDGGIFWANGGELSSALLAKLCAQRRGSLWNAGRRERLARSGSHSAVHEMERAMKRLFILAVIFGLAAFGPANAQRGNPASATPSVSLSPTVTRGAAPSGGQRETNPAFIPQGPCSVSPNATGGVTTSSSCGTDPLEVPAQTFSSASSPAQVSGGTTRSAQSSGASSSGGGTASSNAGSAPAASNAGGGGGGAPSSSGTLCSSSVSSTSGTLGAGSLISGSGC